MRRQTVDKKSDGSNDGKQEKWRAFEINTVFPRKDKERQFCSNRISTSKYTILTFLPLNLFEQFSKMSNFYFLMLTLMETIKPIASAGGW